MPKSPKRILKLGTRSSALALTQSRQVARQLERAHPGLQVALVEIATTGDRVTGQALSSFGGAGVFVKELEAALLDGRVDLAVHSLKDVPTRQPKGLVIAAISKREDARDVLVAPAGKKFDGLDPLGQLGSGSPRRRAQLKAWRPNLRFAEIRGNVETRIRKVDDGQYAGTILALAGLKRLGLRARASEIISFDRVLPAPGQGALGIECRGADRRVRILLRALNDPDTAACVAAERTLLEALGGGCHLPLGALGQIAPKGTRGSKKSPERLLRLRAALGHPDGSWLVRGEVIGRPEAARSLGRALARQILNGGGARSGRMLLDSLRNDGLKIVS